MKKLYYILLLLLCGTTFSCMNGDGYDWEDPTDDLNEAFGNPYIKETKVLTIQALKAKYPRVLTDTNYVVQITEDIQIKGYVTGNDIQGNLYNQLSLQDETGALFVSVAQGGMFAYLPEGTEILIDLKGLYFGCSNMSVTLGMHYTGKNGNEQVGRMSRTVWNQHFAYTGKKKMLEPEVFAEGNGKTTWTLNNDAAKLGVIKNVSFSKASYYNNGWVNLPLTDESTYAVPDYTTSWYFNEQSTNVFLYNSSYADFAAKKLPHGKVNVTGIFMRYRNNWEIIIRSIDDVEEVE